MAMPYEQPAKSGRWVYEFIFDGKRHRIRLGKVKGSKATVIANCIDEICGQLETGAGLLTEQVKWLVGLSDRFHRVIARHLPVPPRVVACLGEWVDRHIADRKDLSPGGKQKLEQTRDKLTNYFGAAKRLRDITADSASKWRTRLRETLSEATCKTHCGNAKAFFSEAVERKLITESPMAHLASGSTARDDSQYIAAGDVLKVMHQLKNDELKLRLAFCRFAGMRVDSEPPTLRWAHIDLKERKMRVASKKTQRFAGKKMRIVPICDVLYTLLVAQWNGRSSDDEPVCKIGRLNGWHKEVIDRAIKAAGLKLWPDRFQSLRASYDTDIRDHLPDYAADAITGHSGEVARKHYNQNVPDEVFSRAYAVGSDKAAQKAAHSLAVSMGMEEPAREASLSKASENQPSDNFAIPQETVAVMGDKGFEPLTSTL